MSTPGAKTTSTQALGGYHVIFRECIICAKLSTVEVVQDLGGITSVLWGDSFSTVGDSFSTVEVAGG